MSRPQGHRKSQSTSALAVIAASGPSTSLSQSTAATPRASRRPQPSRLGAVVEDDAAETTSRSPGIDQDLARLQEAMSKKKAKDVAEKERRLSKPADGLEEVKAAINDIRSLRSSDRRRLAAVRKVERALVQACAAVTDSPLAALLQLELHSALVALLTRHAQTLSHRALRTHTTLSSSDELANGLKPELASIVLTLQGLCLIDRRAKEELGQSWMLELMIDMLLVLRAQTAVEGERPIVYLMLDLLCCILVDSPAACRAFEALNGLEGVVRVLKGTGVPKEVRMKCIEFLYFYLLPEATQEKEGNRTPSASSSSTTSSTSSQLYPPTASADDMTPLPSPTTPSRRNKISTPDTRQYADLDIPFVPQTPQKRPEPSLGYLTPSTRRVSSSSTGPNGLPVPPSPHRVSASPSHRRLSSINADESDNSGVGLGLPRSSTATNLARRPSVKRDITAIQLTSDDSAASPNPSLFDTASSRTTTGSSSGSSTVVPPRGISRSSTHQVLSSTSSSGLSRTPSVKRLDGHDVTLSSSDDVGQARPPKIRPSRTSMQLSDIASDSPSDPAARQPKPRLSQGPAPPSALQKVRQSRTSLHLADLASDSPSGEGRPPKPRLSQARTPSSVLTGPVRTPSPNTSMPPPPVPKLTPRKGFPASITKGLPSAASSPNLNSPLGISKRIPSGQLAGKRSSSKLKEVKSVDDKKELLGQWLGNVDALVEGVEKVSFWGSVGHR